ncbi:MAG TPA: ATP-binding protein [Steroidobacteraceae bacterium]|jgi:two-component system sensor histidine kinase ChvG|nr:ATP-binding protein [Steroidobacteraceae bacterium]
MSLRLKLLLLGFASLVLPLAGYEYAREMEAALRVSEQQSLQAIVQTIATSLQGRTDLLYRMTPDSGLTAPGPEDLQAVPLLTAPFLDGYGDEWPHSSPFRRVFADGPRQLALLVGVHERMVYLLIEVRDPHVVWDAPGVDVLDPAGFGDRVWVAFTDAAGAQHQYLFATAGPGPVHARRIETEDLGRQVAIDELRIIGGWQPMNGGYRVELRIPLSMLGARLGVLVDAREHRGADPVSFGTLDHDSLAPQGRLLIPSPELSNYLAQFIQPGLRLTVTGTDRAVLSQVDALSVTTVAGAQRGLLPQLYRRMLERPDDRKVVQAQAPIAALDRHQTLGSVEIVETAERSLTLRDKALTQLLDFTLITSALVVILMFSFAAWLAWRLARLRQASESALTREGLVTTFPETAAPDELGDVARSFSMLLGRLNEYTGYLRTLAGKLAHEIRTPLTIVRSSLDNLESEQVTPAARTYLDRAREGSERLSAILVAMGAATRVEEAIQSAERSGFDLRALIDSAVGAYRTGFPQRQFSAELPAAAVPLSGAPDLIVQMLDKLVDNAVDFSPEGATITLRLAVEAGQVLIEVDNPGPILSGTGHSHLFESLWQSRSGADSRPHFGLGLYIVRLIAEFHGGTAQALNLSDGSGVRFRILLPSQS